MKFIDAMNRRARAKIAEGKKLSARFGILSLISAVLVMGYQMFSGLLNLSPDTLAQASFGWFAVLAFGVAGLFLDDRRTFSFFGIFSFFVFGLPLIVISSELLGLLG
jgi:hypothetical protein